MDQKDHWKMNTYENKGRLLTDSECDTSLDGNGFIVESQTNRSVGVQGFTDSVKVERLPIVSAITAYVPEDEAILL